MLSPMAFALPDQLTVARIAVVPIVVVLFEWDLSRQRVLATAVFAAAMASDYVDGLIARRRGHASASGPGG